MSARLQSAVLIALLTAGVASARPQDEASRAVAAAVERAAKARDAARPDDMKREIGKAVALAGDRVPLRRVMAGALVDNGLPELAVQICAQTIPLAPDDAALHGIYGIALTKVKKYPEAAAELDIATAKDPGRKEWWVNLGRARLFANQEALALAAIERATKLAPDDVDVLGVRAECEYRNMRLPECEASSLLLLKKDPKSLMGWQLLIRVRRTQAKAAEAMATADDAVKAVGRHPDILIERGLALLLADRNEDAVKDFRDAAQQLPKDPRPQLHLCKALTRLGRTQEAAAAKARYLELSPDVAKPATRKSGER